MTVLLTALIFSYQTARITKHGHHDPLNVIYMREHSLFFKSTYWIPWWAIVFENISFYLNYLLFMRCFFHMPLCAGRVVPACVIQSPSKLFTSKHSIPPLLRHTQQTDKQQCRLNDESVELPSFCSLPYFSSLLALSLSKTDSFGGELRQS